MMDRNLAELIFTSGRAKQSFVGGSEAEDLAALNWTKCVHDLPTVD